MDYLLKASAVIALFYLCFFFFLKKETFFNHNRWFLLMGLVIALVFPLIVIPIYIPIEPITISEASNVLYENVTNITTTTQTESVFEWVSLIPIIYGIGICLLFIQFLLQFGSLILLLIRNPKNKDGIYTYVIVENKISPFSFFKWIVYNPKNYNSDELQLILIHEKVHANQIHSIDILFTQLACVIFWFNPLIWLYRKEVRQNLEYIADFKTQSISQIEKEYQRLLLKTSISYHKISLSNNFYNSLIKERIVMLKKSRSNRKKQWRYVLILPLLAGLLISMNTKDIYVEGEVPSLNSEKTLEFIVTKNTSNNELKSMSEAVEQKGGTLVFSKIHRNKTNELTNIFLKLNNHSYGNSGQPIEPFIIYKELFGLGGGYVGRINGATSHYDNNEKFYDEKTSDELVKRAHKAILKSGIQTKEALKDFDEERSESKKGEIDKKAKPSKSVKKTSPGKNKSVAISAALEVKEDIKTEGDISITIITKNTTDSELDAIKEQLKKEGLTAKFKGVKRNKNGEITAIKIDVKSKKSNASYNVNSNEAIDNVKIIYNEDKNSISIGNGHSIQGKNTFVYETKGSKHKLHKSGNGSHVYVISDEEHDHEEGEEHEHEQDTIYITKANGKKGKVKRVKRTKTVEVISGDDNEVIEILIDEDDEHEVKKIIVNGKKVNVVEGKENIVVKGKAKNVWISDDNVETDVIILKNGYDKKNVFISNDGDKNPLFIIDGKEVTKDQFVDLKSDSIESVKVLKDKSAIEKYGDKAKDGVIIIKTKKKN